MENPSYYSILTADVRYDERLTSAEKILYSEITALSNKHGYCTAMNGYFSKLYKVAPQTVSRWIADLEKCGFIVREVERDENNQVIGRKIYPISSPLFASERGEVLTKMLIGSKQNCLEGINKNVKENITRVNTTRLNNISCASNDGASDSLSTDDHKSKPKDHAKQVEADFESLWALYPNKKGKKEALRHYKAWIKKSSKNTKEVMQTKLDSFLHYLKVRGTAPEYVPYGSTWFNGRYDDDYSTKGMTTGNKKHREVGTDWSKVKSDANNIDLAELTRELESEEKGWDG